ncbi:hypothetical protein ACNOYE_17635 [Nannocystaceae bacterium ST9]
MATLVAPDLAWAGPREDMKAAYAQALAQANELEYDAALATINNSIASAEGAGAGQDPVLASLYVLRAALVFSLEGGKAKDKIVADLQRALTLNYYVVVPVEMRSDDLTKYMDQARKAVGAGPGQPITHTSPKVSCGEPLLLEALLGVPDGGQAALYWRKAGSGGEFVGAEMPVFSNVAEAVIPAAEHGDGGIEYFIFAFDASSNPVANLGTQEQPLSFEQTCAKEAEPEPVVVEPEPDEKKKKPRGGPSSLPRVWINLGIGTGIGLATGTAENTYRQFFPRGNQAYGAGEAGCAIARWVAGNGEVTDLSAAELGAAFQTFGNPALVDDMMVEFDAEKCAERHPVSTGMAIAPFHVAPEVSFRVGKRISLGLFTRLQVVTGAKAFREDPTKDLDSSFTQDVRSFDPQGVKQKIKFSWTIGAKFKYFLGKDDKKFRPYVGAFAGYGTARLRVDMGFSNDRNGNSVPDSLEVGSDSVSQDDCFPVWPYNNSCDNTDAGDADDLLAVQVSQNAAKANRVDVVRIGSGFIGALVGFNYQIVKNFAFFGELNVGAWFPNQTSILFDLTVGPSITF